MARYKINVPEPGTTLYDEGGYGGAVVAESIDEARELLEDFEVHPSIGRCYALTKAMIECGEGGEDSEPGDTWVTYLPFEERELGSAECLVWEKGPPPLRGWSIKPLGFAQVGVCEWPVGTIFNIDEYVPGETLDEWRLLEPMRPAPEGWEAKVEAVEFGKPREETGEVRTLFLALGDSLWISGFSPWKPEPLYQLEVQGETAEGSYDEMYALLKWAEDEMAAKWRQELYAGERDPLLREAVCA